MTIMAGVFIILVFYCLSVWLYRGLLDSIILYQLNNSAQKKVGKARA